jgi:site-specific DNA-methyltransferase (adenine-specific)
LNRILQGDNLEALRRMATGEVALIYIDPPFNTGRRQTRLRMKTVRDEAGDRVGFGGRRYRTELVKAENGGAGAGESGSGAGSGSAGGYADRFDDFLGFLRPRLVEAHRVLTPTGSLFLHIDYREAHYCKVMLDEIFGRECFQNEIIWAYDYGARATKRWPAKHDNILWYTKDLERYTFHLGESDRIPYMAPGLVGAEKAARGKTPTDVWWHTIVSPTGREDRLRDPEAAGDSGADCAGAFEPGRPGAGFFCGQRDHGRGGGEAWAGVLHGGRERRGDCGDGKTVANQGGEIMMPPSRLIGRVRWRGHGSGWQWCGRRDGVAVG